MYPVQEQVVQIRKYQKAQRPHPNPMLGLVAPDCPISDDLYRDR